MGPTTRRFLYLFFARPVLFCLVAVALWVLNLWYQLDGKLPALVDCTRLLATSVFGYMFLSVFVIAWSYGAFRLHQARRKVRDEDISLDAALEPFVDKATERKWQS